MSGARGLVGNSFQTSRDRDSAVPRDRSEPDGEDELGVGRRLEADRDHVLAPTAAACPAPAATQRRRYPTRAPSSGVPPAEYAALLSQSAIPGTGDANRVSGDPKSAGDVAAGGGVAANAVRARETGRASARC